MEIRFMQQATQQLLQGRVLYTAVHALPFSFLGSDVVRTYSAQSHVCEDSLGLCVGVEGTSARRQTALSREPTSYQESSLAMAF